MDKELNELLICNCSSCEHQLIFSTVPEDCDKWVYVHVHLVKRSFWERLWAGIKYICGHKCVYGNFEEVILDKSHVESLQKVIDYLKQD